MSINYPTSLDTFTNPASTDKVTNPSHADQHSNANDAIEALQAKVGVDGSAVTLSHDYKLSGVTGSDKAASLTGTETLTNKTLTSPVLDTQATGSAILDDDTMATASAITLATSESIKAYVDSNPGSYLTASSTDTLTNKTFDANGTGNSISNIETPDIASDTLVTALDSIASNNNDTTWPTCAAVIDYVSASTGGDLIASGTAASVSGTTNETALISTSIIGGTIGTNGVIYAKLFIDELRSQSGHDVTIRLKYGSTTLASKQITWTSNSSDLPGIIECWLVGAGTTGTQRGFMKLDFSAEQLNADSTTQVKFVKANVAGSASEDSTGNLNFEVTAQWTGANADSKIAADSYYVASVLS